MKWGDELPAAARPVVAAPARARSASPSTPRRGSGTTQAIGGGRCPVVDTWWQTETGAIMISALPGATTLKPGSATFPLPGIEAEHRRRRGQAGRDPRRRLPRARAAVAVDAARHLGRPRALPRHVLEPLRRPVLRRRRRQARRRGLLLAARPRRRHHARRRATTSPRPRSSPRSSTIPRWPRRRSSGAPTTRPVRRSPRS